MVVLLTAAAIAWPRLACPPSYVPDLDLWTGIRGADLVVAARVVDIDVNEAAVFVAHVVDKAADGLWHRGFRIPMPSFEPAAALTLEIDETIKGTPRRRATFRLKGVYTEDISLFSSKAVFFLSRKGWTWELTRYPVLYLNRGELDDLRVVIGRALAIARPSGDEGALMEWLVDAAVRPGTRGQVLHLLRQPLPPSVLDRLAAGFIAQPLNDRSVPRMLMLLADYPSLEVDRAARSGLEVMELPFLRSEVEGLLRERSNRFRLQRLQGRTEGENLPW
jgi:hypothetical protein